MSTKNMLSLQDSMIIISLHRIVAELDRQTKQVCKNNNLSLGQFMVLEALHNRGELSVGEIKNLVLSTDGTIPVIIGNLEKMGCVTRRQDDLDKRKYMIKLTAEGADLISRVCPENNEILTKSLGVISPEDKLVLIEMINKYRSSFKHK